MTPTEKVNLFAAIGYDEHVTPNSYPKSFVSNRFEFCLKKLNFLLHDYSNEKESTILLSSVNHVEAIIEQRLVAKAIQIHVTVGDFLIEGCSSANGGNLKPILARSFRGKIVFKNKFIQLQLLFPIFFYFIF